ncbi:S9 family peptidase [Shewanella schlegeliana]|uniref:S9 family peptidase n=1 Tax=Shewanella schlegeliana TaxID=190308 RepID=A0ABS1T0P7_9GAMM|nr:S9 family peptidase [Shewanella schlegeliana]MBL4914354.1 S9 family peptidase [Shewanella schlegeliana]MCL1109423.1 S9 family peptidase [Shewanella schlegeliana]GIU32024.1 peptidase S9 [Shewanella schlegeliana]
MNVRWFFCLALFFQPYLLAYELLPVDAFGALPQSEQVKLSPDGKHFSYVINKSGNSYLGVTNIQTGEKRILVHTDNQIFKITWYLWANNQQILISADYPAGKKQKKHTITRLLKIKIDGKSKAESVFQPRVGDLRPQFQNRIIDILPDEPNHILMQLSLKSYNRPDVYKLDISSKRKRSLVHRGNSDTTFWMADRQHRVRLGYAIDETKRFYRLCDKNGENWRKVWEYELFDEPDVTPLGFGLNPEHLYIRALHKGRYAIFVVDVSTKDLDRELIYADARYDIEGSLIYSTKTNDVIGVYHGEANNGKIYFDEKYEEFQAALNKAIPDSFNDIVSMSHDENKYILFSRSNATPGAYYLGDRKAKYIDYILQQYPKLYEQSLSPKTKIKYQSRDGIEIEGYVTLPHKNVPNKHAAIVIPHGGPMVREYSGFDWFSQFFASRGYTVLEPNFRGSSGYGFEFEVASIRQWGGKMQDDLADAAHWMVKQYRIPAKQVCIVGSSYGGYAAMMAAVKQQNTFKCSASFAGVSDLEYIVSSAKNFTNYDIVKKQFGSDSDYLEQQSPVNFSKKINIPLLLIHGEHDTVVDVYHSREMYAELKAVGKQVDYIELKNGNHYLEIEANRLATLEAIEAFLNRHL